MCNMYKVKMSDKSLKLAIRIILLHTYSIPSLQNMLIAG